MSTEDNIKRLIGAADVETRADEAEWNQFARRAHGALFMKRIAAGLGTIALVGVVAFAAVSMRGINETEPIPPAPAPDTTSELATEETAAADEQVEVPPTEQELWFVQGEKLSWGTTVAGGSVSTSIAGDQPPDARNAFWLDLLLQGPMGPDQEAGVTTAIPQGTELLRVMRNGPTLYVDLSSEFESGGGSLSMQMRVAQVVYTGTQSPGIDSVRIMIEGEMVDAIGGEGFIVSEPLTRRDFQDFAPNVVVETPRPGDEFSPGDTAAGFANVFEANVSFMVLDKDGNELKLTTPFTTATCGSGCWGDFTHALDFPLTEAQEGRIVVLTYSAEDGSPQDEVSIPVMLVP